MPDRQGPRMLMVFECDVVIVAHTTTYVYS